MTTTESIPGNVSDEERMLRASLAHTLESALAIHNMEGGMLIVYDPKTKMIRVAARHLTPAGTKLVLEAALANRAQLENEANDVRVN